MTQRFPMIAPTIRARDGDGYATR